MAAPLEETPFVLPSVVFRPARLAVFCILLSGVSIALAALAGAVMFGVFFAIGLVLGLANAQVVSWSVAAIAAQDHPLKRGLALNSATRLLVITLIALIVAFVFRPFGFGVLFGLALFQVVLVLSTVVPVWMKIRKGELDAPVDSETQKS
ncbi:MAG: ATP synthase subunit I [Actinobacteria bacterium]|uniref:Unannotated protein n=1 Tax=freshwater metagenome TaxID=449393 RepID=A0A6J7DHZ0_9ZZZZ|nr:ATP synthase subunit I [Actinomycetota bacterium]MSY41156.1 ATP synthase subunit I [Actinomycetota bacterium]